MRAHPMGHQKGADRLRSTTEQIETKTTIWLHSVVGSTMEIMVFFTSKSYQPSMESWCFTSLKLVMGEDHLLRLWHKSWLSHRVKSYPCTALSLCCCSLLLWHGSVHTMLFTLGFLMLIFYFPLQKRAKPLLKAAHSASLLVWRVYASSLYLCLPLGEFVVHRDP